MSNAKEMEKEEDILHNILCYVYIYYISYILSYFSWLSINSSYLHSCLEGLATDCYNLSY